MLNVVTRIVAVILIIVMTASLVLYVLGMRSMYVVSNSMSPTFSRGSLLIVSRDHDHPRVGDIIAFEPEWFTQGVVTHRVHAIRGSEIFTKGDNNPVVDPAPVTSDRVDGRVLIIVPFAGLLVNTPVLTAFIVIFNILVLMSLVIQHFDNSRNDSRNGSKISHTEGKLLMSRYSDKSYE